MLKERMMKLVQKGFDFPIKFCLGNDFWASVPLNDEFKNRQRFTAKQKVWGLFLDCPFSGLQIWAVDDDRPKILNSIYWEVACLHGGSFTHVFNQKLTLKKKFFERSNLPLPASTHAQNEGFFTLQMLSKFQQNFKVKLKVLKGLL